MGMRCWNVGDHVSGIALAAVPLLGVLRAYLAMVYRPNPWSQAQQEAFFENIGFKNWFGTIFAGVISPAALGLAAIRNWTYYSSTLWAVLFGSLAILNLCVLALGGFLFINRKRFDGNAKASADAAVDQEGRT